MKIRIDDRINGVAITNAKVEEVTLKKDNIAIVVLEKLTSAQTKMFEYFIFRYFKQSNIMVSKDINALITTSAGAICGSGKVKNVWYNEHSKPSVEMEYLVL